MEEEEGGSFCFYFFYNKNIKWRGRVFLFFGVGGEIVGVGDFV